MTFKYIVNCGAGPLPQVRGGRVCTCALARCRVVIAKLANQNVCLPVFGRFVGCMWSWSAPMRWLYVLWGAWRAPGARGEWPL